MRFVCGAHSFTKLHLKNVEEMCLSRVSDCLNLDQSLKWSKASAGFPLNTSWGGVKWRGQKRLEKSL